MEEISRLHIAPYSESEEVANVITHGFGVLLATLGFYFLAVEASRTGDLSKIGSSIVFGLCMINCYICSTLYHAVNNLEMKHRMRIADHIGIYLMIAGTYTPFMLVSMDRWIGWTFFVLIWGCAIVGIVVRLRNRNVPEYVSATPYVIMGWLVLIAIKPLFDSLGWEGINLILLGGIFYTIGVLFYRADNFPFNHSIWHLFVLAGSITHYFTILNSVIQI
jgi:hemolysin III